MQKIKSALYTCSLPRLVCNHMFGQQHTDRHRMAVGAAVMLVGVTIARGSAEIHIMAIHMAGDLIGYLVHGLGAVPFVERLIRDAEQSVAGIHETE